jgi:hypothetical protein
MCLNRLRSALEEKSTSTRYEYMELGHIDCVLYLFLQLCTLKSRVLLALGSQAQRCHLINPPCWLETLSSREAVYQFCGIICLYN